MKIYVTENGITREPVDEIEFLRAVRVGAYAPGATASIDNGRPDTLFRTAATVELAMEKRPLPAANPPPALPPVPAGAYLPSYVACGGGGLLRGLGWLLVAASPFVFLFATSLAFVASEILITGANQGAGLVVALFFFLSGAFLVIAGHLQRLVEFEPRA